MNQVDDRVTLGIALMLGFCAVAPLLDVAAKLAAPTIPVSQITTTRFLLQGVIMLPICLWMRHPITIERSLLGLLALRGFFLILATYCFMAAIAVMPIADALAIVFIEPFILLVMGKWLFNEQVGRRRISASIIGFAGVLLVIQPSFSIFGLVALFPLGTALAFAFYMLVTRRLSRQMEPVPMQLHTATLATAMCLPILLWGHLSDHPTLSPLLAPVMPEGIAWLWLLGVGVFASLSHLLITYALRFAPSATLAPLHYLEMVSAVSFGYLVF
ncbi:MAG TPA: EamA family transporter, partial [Rhodobacteraceae bacterium]|nr:EamA family transporter [Paracoccaceae bacterium]